MNAVVSTTRQWNLFSGIFTKVQLTINIFPRAVGSLVNNKEKAVRLFVICQMNTKCAFNTMSTFNLIQYLGGTA